MATITISRQLGSLGLEIAEGVADRLGYRLIRRQAINDAARRAGAPEAALADIDELGLLKMSPSPRGHQEYRRALDEVMHELAREGSVVIVGRAGQVILADWPGALHVRIVAPVATRAARLVERGIELKAAFAQIEASDRSRRDFLRRSYHARWDDPALYHLIVNTAKFSAAEATELVAQSARRLDARGAKTMPEDYASNSAS